VNECKPLASGGGGGDFLGGGGGGDGDGDGSGVGGGVVAREWPERAKLTEAGAYTRLHFSST
jgi:hypothetical protein